MATTNAGTRSTTASKSLGHVLVTGGTGFLGSTICNLLLERSVTTKLSAVDLRPAKEPLDGVEYNFGDITDEVAMRELFSKLKPNVVIHTASPHLTINMPEVMYKVNVEGTKTMVKVAQETGVKAFVYTSSASVIHDTQSDLINADESYPYVMGEKQPEYYTTTKALAEIHVLEQNRPKDYPKFLTCAIRPSGIFGAGDMLATPRIMQAYYKGQTKFQLGDNDNLFDWTEVSNVAHAHHLAATALLTTREREDAGKAIPLDTEKVDGEAFLITNDQTCFFWDFSRMIWRACGDTTQPKQVWKLSREFGMLLAAVFEWVYFFAQWGQPNLTRQVIRYSAMTRYFNIDKAKRRLGYRPVISLEDGVNKGVAHLIRTGEVQSMPDSVKGNVPEHLKKYIVEKQT